MSADAADDEGRCMKAELEILRNQARRNAASLAQHLPCSMDLPTSPETPTMQMHDGMQSDKAATPCLTDEAQRSGTAAVQIQSQGGQGQRQGQGQGHSQGQGQRQGQSSGEASEAELAAVEQGLSALEQQITAAALRYATQGR